MVENIDEIREDVVAPTWSAILRDWFRKALVHIDQIKYAEVEAENVGLIITNKTGINQRPLCEYSAIVGRIVKKRCPKCGVEREYIISEAEEEYSRLEEGHLNECVAYFDLISKGSNTSKTVCLPIDKEFKGFYKIKREEIINGIPDQSALKFIKRVEKESRAVVTQYCDYASQILFLEKAEKTKIITEIVEICASCWNVSIRNIGREADITQGQLEIYKICDDDLVFTSNYKENEFYNHKIVFNAAHSLRPFNQPKRYKILIISNDCNKNKVVPIDEKPDHDEIILPVGTYILRHPSRFQDAD